jgi:cytochrome c-type biogenesis protein CcmH/NrfG
MLMDKSAILLLLALLPGLAFPQSASISPAETPAGRQITGQVRLAGQAAPGGVTVVLRIVNSKYATPLNEAEVARTVTDAAGRFVFDHLESVGGHNGREFFAVTTQPAGYTPAYRVVDLTLASQATTTLDLQKASTASTPNDDSASPRRPSPAASEALARAQELLFRKHDPGASIPEFRKALKADPWYGPGYVLLGLAHMQMQSWSDAQWAFTEATKVEPGNAQAFLGLGSALNEQHDYAGAQKALESSLERDPKSAEAHYELARTFGALGKWELAGPHAQRAIEINPDYAGPHALMGNVYLDQEDLKSALAEFREYLRLAPDGSLAPSVKQIISDIEKAIDGQPRR